MCQSGGHGWLTMTSIDFTLKRKELKEKGESNLEI